jgi:uncharacterized protein YecE (DUF72 family)
MALYIGTSGWAYSSWKPAFYPAGTPAKNLLGYYSSQLNSVEVNYTFRSADALTPDLAARWIEEAARGFVFAFKAPQEITHYKQYRLKNTSALVKKFAASLKPFRKRGQLGPVLFQLPPFFKADSKVLNNFLRGWPKGLRCAFEFRNPSWFVEPVYEVLRKHRAALCIAGSDKLKTPEIDTTDFVYYRFREGNYSSAALRSLSKLCANHLSVGRDVYGYFKHEETAVSAERALQLKRALERNRTTQAER